MVGDVLVEHRAEAAALLSGHNRGGIDGRKDGLGDEGFGEQRAGADSLAYICEKRAQSRSGGAFGKQIERGEDRKAGLEQRIELLIEDQEVLAADETAGARAAKAAG